MKSCSCTKALQFDEHGKPSGPFDDLLRTYNWSAARSREYVGWERESQFPYDAKVVLLENALDLHVPHLLKWTGLRPPLEFLGSVEEDLTHLTGTCAPPPPEAKKISVYPLRDRRGEPVYFLVQRGKDPTPLENISLAWSGGPVNALIPPSPQSVRLVPSGGKLALPVWRNVLILRPTE